MTRLLTQMNPVLRAGVCFAPETSNGGASRTGMPQNIGGSVANAGGGVGTGGGVDVFVGNGEAHTPDITTGSAPSASITARPSGGIEDVPATHIYLSEELRGLIVELAVRDEQLPKLPRSLSYDAPENWEKGNIFVMLSKIGATAVVPLIRLLEDPSPAVRGVAAAGLALIGDERAFDPLEAVLKNDASDYCRRVAYFAYYSIYERLASAAHTSDRDPPANGDSPFFERYFQLVRTIDDLEGHRTDCRENYLYDDFASNLCYLSKAVTLKEMRLLKDFWLEKLAGRMGRDVYASYCLLMMWSELNDRGVDVAPMLTQVALNYTYGAEIQEPLFQFGLLGVGNVLDHDMARVSLMRFAIQLLQRLNAMPVPSTESFRIIDVLKYLVASNNNAYLSEHLNAEDFTPWLRHNNFTIREIALERISNYNKMDPKGVIEDLLNRWDFADDLSKSRLVASLVALDRTKAYDYARKLLWSEDRRVQMDMADLISNYCNSIDPLFECIFSDDTDGKVRRHTVTTLESRFHDSAQVEQKAVEFLENNPFLLKEHALLIRRIAREFRWPGVAQLAKG